MEFSVHICEYNRSNADYETIYRPEGSGDYLFLLADDFSLDVIKYLSSKGVLSVDVQGVLRKVDNEKVLPVDWTEKKIGRAHV